MWLVWYLSKSHVLSVITPTLTPQGVVSFVKSWFWIIVWPHSWVVCNISFDFCSDFQCTFTDWTLYLHFWPNQWRVEQGLSVATDFTRNSDEQITQNRLLTIWMAIWVLWLNSGLITSFYFQWKMPGLLKLVQVKTFQLSVALTPYSPLCLRVIYFPLWSKRKYKFINIFKNPWWSPKQNLFNRSQNNTRKLQVQFAFNSKLNSFKLRFLVRNWGKWFRFSSTCVGYFQTPQQKPRLYRTSFPYYLKLSKEERFYKHSLR